MATKKKVQEEVKSVKESMTQKVVDKREEIESKAKVEAASKLTIDGVARDISKLDVQLSSTLRDIHNQLKTELAKLDAVNVAINAKQAELESLYNKDVVIRSVEELLAEYEATKTKLESDIEARKQDFAKLETELALSLKESETASAKKRKVDEEEYEYKKSILRRNDEDAWKKFVSDRDFTEKKRAAEFEQQFVNRTKELLEKQSELEKKESELNTLHGNIKKELEKELVSLEKVLETKHANELKFVKQDYESKLILANANNENLRSQVESLKVDIRVKNEQIAELNKQVASMAMNSIQAIGSAKQTQAVLEAAKSVTKQ